MPGRKRDESLAPVDMATPFSKDYLALVIGASGSIGQAFVQAFQQDLWCAHVEVVSRSHTNGFDLLDHSGKSCANIAAFMPELHIFDSVTVLALMPSPAPPSGS